MEKPEGPNHYAEKLHEKVVQIEILPIPVAERAQLILLLLDEKSAHEIDLKDEDTAIEVAGSLSSIGFIAEVRHKPSKFNISSVIIAKSQEIVDELQQFLAYENHVRYGELMGYPSSAIDAFIGKTNRLSNTEQDKLMDLEGKIADRLFGGNFAFSESNKLEEMELVRNRLKLLAEKAPELFLETFGADLGEKILSHLLKYD